ncbi:MULTISPECIES: hypothetical protein [Enterobacteriaceae]|uniref:hypothetical protein n=1 Tax=Enterobacteriaceae TaxID=543 RepID=UPI000B950CC2|nr:MULTISPECIES: hypothetical protein [Enterobacteriaceae]OYI56197.1 hypothetical protein CI688_13055 [Shigella sonnei]HCN5210813.1 hypothetical protein [Escherichia coli]
METVSITFNAQQLSIIGEALGNLAYRIADPVVKHINQQIAQQEEQEKLNTPERTEEIDDSVSEAKL